MIELAGISVQFRDIMQTYVCLEVMYTLEYHRALNYTHFNSDIILRHDKYHMEVTVSS